MRNNKSILLIFILLLSFQSCSNYHVSDVAKKHTEVSMPTMSKLLLDSLSFSEQGTDFLFIVDASCSSCIKQFIEEISLLNEVYPTQSRSGKKIVLLPSGTSKVVRFYISKQNLFSPSEFSFVELDQLNSSEIIYEYNGFFFKVNNGIFKEMWVPTGLEL